MEIHFLLSPYPYVIIPHICYFFKFLSQPFERLFYLDGVVMYFRVLKMNALIFAIILCNLFSLFLLQEVHANVKPETGVVRRHYEGEGCAKLPLVGVADKCHRIGQFPVPGNCTIFASCNRGIPEPIFKACPPNHNFFSDACVNIPDENDCPQIHCRPEQNVNVKNQLPKRMALTQEESANDHNDDRNHQSLLAGGLNPEYAELLKKLQAQSQAHDSTSGTTRKSVGFRVTFSHPDDDETTNIPTDAPTQNVPNSFAMPSASISILIFLGTSALIFYA